MARWLLGQDYGAFSVCWSVLLLLAAFHNALILEPMTVVGPSEFHDRLPNYFHANGRLNTLVCLALALAAVAFALFYRQQLVRSCLFVLAFCVPGYLSLLTGRRKQYVLNQPARALHFSLLYAALVFAFVTVLRASGRLNAMTAVAAFGTTWLLMPLMRSPAQAAAIPLRLVAREHWRYGKWIFASSLLAIGASDLQTLLLSLLVDLKAAGALRALINFVLPLSQLLTILSVYALPRLSERAKRWGAIALLRKGILFPAALMTLASIYAVALVVLRQPLERLLYGGKMEAYLRWMPLLAASAWVAAIGASFSTLLRSVQNSQHIFIAGVSGSAVGLACAFLLQKHMGIAGALWSLLAANAASSLVIAGTYFWLVRRHATT